MAIAVGTAEGEATGAEKGIGTAIEVGIEAESATGRGREGTTTAGLRRVTDSNKNAVVFTNTPTPHSPLLASPGNSPAEADELPRVEPLEVAQRYDHHDTG